MTFNWKWGLALSFAGVVLMGHPALAKIDHFTDKDGTVHISNAGEPEAAKPPPVVKPSPPAPQAPAPAVRAPRPQATGPQGAPPRPHDGRPQPPPLRRRGAFPPAGRGENPVNR